MIPHKNSANFTMRSISRVHGTTYGGEKSQEVAICISIENIKN